VNVGICAMRKDREIGRTRVLLVEDFKPFRVFVCSLLQRKPQLEIIAEASDGLEAVQKAEELRPDLILLDIGLPTLNGIGAARQIRKVAPDSTILFLSQETSPDIVQEAISLGALGYVVKIKASSELLIAIDAVLQGKRFLSGELVGSENVGALPQTER
jgi:DNA-binding NarL/FixJ family response regulator